MTDLSHQQRQFKFRAWHRFLKRMDEVTCLNLHNGEVERDGLWARGEQIILMQSTGLKDKNGKELFCDDVTRSKHGGLGRIVWRDAGFHFAFESGQYFVPLTQAAIDEREAEIIGNIYESPELLPTPSRDS